MFLPRQSLFWQQQRPAAFLMSVSTAVPMRTNLTASVEGWKQAKKYLALTSTQKHRFVPKQTESIQTPFDYLKTIGRGCDKFADKFKDWAHLFTAHSKDLDGIPVKQRKYILRSREWFKRGMEPAEVVVPERRKAYLKEREKVNNLRLKKKGLL